MALNIGDRVGSFELLEEIGSGGMGVVFRARDLNSSRVVAVKTLASSSSLRAARLRHESRFLSALDHPGVMPLIANGEATTRDGDPLPWFAMELQESMTLATFRDRLFDWAHDGKTESGRWTPVPHKVTARRPANDTALSLTAAQLPEVARGRLPEVEEIFAALCDALTHVHSRGIVHCDIAPANIFLNGLRPVLADFDIAQRVDARCNRLRANCAPAGAGTSHYMSPEQFTGAPLDARSDLYSLGCVLFELLTGRPPFTGSPATIREGHIYRLPRSPADLVRGVPLRLEALVMALLAKEPHERPPFAQDVKAVLTNKGAEANAERRRRRAFNPQYLYPARFTGRPELVGELVERIEASRRGQGTLVLVRGPEGAGKSRLLCSACEAEGTMAIELLPSPSEAHWSKSFEPLFDFAASTLLAEVDGPLARWAASSAQIIAPISESIAELVRDEVREVDEDALLDATRSLMQTLAGDRGLILIADDLDRFAPRAQRALVEASTLGDPRARPLVLAAAGRDWSAPNMRADGVRVIDLGALEATDLTQICRDALADEDLPESQLARFVLSSRGLPGPLLDALAEAVHQKQVRRRGPGHWIFDDASSSSASETSASAE